jgi:pimeloyl-ACP methyl ester carboxylesterase
MPVDRHPAQSVRTRSGELRCRIAGEPGSPAMVLLHGIGSGSGSWVHQLDAFGDHFRVIAWDAPGYGGSTPLAPDAPVAADYADALLALLDALGIARCLLVAQSLGALMAGAFAARHPERLDGLVLISPARGYGLASETERASKLAARLEAMDRLGPAGLAEARAANLLSPQASAEALSLVRDTMARLDPSGHAQAARLLAHGRLAEDAARYAGPVLVLCGSADRVTLPADCEDLAAAFPAARYRCLPGPGHASYVEAATLVNEAIGQFAHQCGLC